MSAGSHSVGGRDVAVLGAAVLFCSAGLAILARAATTLSPRLAGRSPESQILDLVVLPGPARLLGAAGGAGS